MSKEYLVCDEQIKGSYCGNYVIHSAHDLYPTEFRVLTSFDTFKEADDYIEYMRHPEDYFNCDDD